MGKIVLSREQHNSYEQIFRKYLLAYQQKAHFLNLICANSG